MPNSHNTGNIQGVLAAHVGMRVRFTVKVNARLGLVQEQRATILDFVFKEEDRARYNGCQAGELFRPRFLPAGVWLQVDDFVESPICEELGGIVGDEQARRGMLLSRATTMEDMLLLRPPPRDILEAGPPRNVKAALERFRKTIVDNRTVTEELARSLGFPLD